MWTGEAKPFVAQGLSNHPNDKQEALPTLSAIDPRLGKAEAAAMDNGYFSENNITGCETLGIASYIATGCEYVCLNENLLVPGAFH